MSDLNQQIALLAGYRVEKLHTDEQAYAPPNDYILANAEGVMIRNGKPFTEGAFTADFLDEEQARNQGGRGSVWDHVPDYEHSLDAVEAELPKQYQIVIHPSRKRGFYSAEIDAWNSPKNWQGVGKTRREAAALALEQYLLSRVARR